MMLSASIFSAMVHVCALVAALSEFFRKVGRSHPDGFSVLGVAFFSGVYGLAIAVVAMLALHLLSGIPWPGALTVALMAGMFAALVAMLYSGLRPYSPAPQSPVAAGAREPGRAASIALLTVFVVAELVATLWLVAEVLHRTLEPSK